MLVARAPRQTRVRRAAVALLLVVGLLAAQSRGALAAFALAIVALPLALRQRKAAAVFVLGLVLAAVGWMAAGGMLRGLEERGLRSNRLALWADSGRMLRDFPLLGSGLNAFGSAYVPYQTIERYEWYGEAHNEYLQALLDTGVVGAFLVATLLVTLFRRALRAAGRAHRRGAIGASRPALPMSGLHRQIPVNGGHFVALPRVRPAGEPPRWRAERHLLTPPDRPPRIATLRLVEWGSGEHFLLYHSAAEPDRAGRPMWATVGSTMRWPTPHRLSPPALISRRHRSRSTEGVGPRGAACTTTAHMALLDDTRVAGKIPCNGARWLGSRLRRRRMIPGAPPGEKHRRGAGDIGDARP